MERMPCRISDGPRHPDEDAEPFPEPSNADREWILSQIDPDWRDHFRDVDIGWEFYWNLNADEMDKLALECADDNRMAEDRGDLCETLADIVRPWTD